MKKISLLAFWQLCQLSPLLAFCPQAASPAPAEPQSITLPIGTEIAISTIDRIDSKTADLNREYAASLDDPVVVDGVTVVPARSSAFLRVMEVKNPKFKRATLALSLIAVTIDGQRVEVNTDKVDSQSGSKAKRTAIGAAAGAATGAGIGALAGGAAGAGIGAAVGTVAGGAAGILTGKGVEIAPETRFTYKLTQPLVVNSQEPATQAGPPAASVHRPVVGSPGEASPQTEVASVQQTPPDAAVAPIAPPPLPPDEPQTPPKAMTNSGSEPELIGAVYFQGETGALMPLERNTGMQRTGNSVYWEMEDAKSPVRFQGDQKMFFVVRLANGIDPATYNLFPLETRNDSRRTKSDPRNRAAPLTLLLNVTKVGESTYGLTPVRNLAAGEYAFSPSNSSNAYCFGVDP
jgi:hypothetical protein